MKLNKIKEQLEEELNINQSKGSNAGFHHRGPGSDQTQSENQITSLSKQTIRVGPQGHLIAEGHQIGGADRNQIL